MHTFFINTSKKQLNAYDVLFDIHYENKTFVSMNCLISDWYDKDNGYVSCVNRMSDMIDGYIELNNDFNLILYIDLPENEVYSSISKSEFSDRDREECSRAMHVLFSHLIHETIVRELISSGRRPQNVLIMFGEEKKFAKQAIEPRDEGIRERIFSFLGIPNMETVKTVALAVQKDDDQDKVAVFQSKLLELGVIELLPGIRKNYEEAFQLWCTAVIKDKNNTSASDELYNHINQVFKAEKSTVCYISCPYDVYASQQNISVLALTNLNIAIHLLKCLESNSIFKAVQRPARELSLEYRHEVESANDEYEKHLLEFHAYTADEIALILKSKNFIYLKKYDEIKTLSKSPAELGLAPKLKEFAHDKFGLDEYGKPGIEQMITQANRDEKSEDKTDDSDKEDDKDDNVLVNRTDTVIESVEKKGTRLFKTEEYKPFDIKPEPLPTPEKKTTPSQYTEQAKTVRANHLNFLERLKFHISHVLSNYAGKSRENKPALLQIGGEKYAMPNLEQNVLENVKDISHNAYKTVLNRYLEFCAGRSVAVTDIDEQCNWFVSRVEQIKASLQKLHMVAIGLFFAVGALYIPFVIIQAKAIVENILTVSTALGSIVLPIMLLLVIFSTLASAQKKKYHEAWKEFVNKVKESSQENETAILKYDQLLSEVIPSLRWVYEYKLDVDYCIECIGIANAKIMHHHLKLEQRIDFIKNVFSDLQYTVPEKDDGNQNSDKLTAEIEYSEPFCTGDKNRKFYSVINLDDLNQTNG